MTSSQTQAIVTAVAAALAILFVFYWITLRQPLLAFIAIGPIVLVLFWIIGTMALLGIPYTLVTATITALSVGIGVDYTIHIIHRYREEFARIRDPRDLGGVHPEDDRFRPPGFCSLTTGLGIGMLIFSPVPALQQFGITAVIAIAYSLIVSMVLVPPAMTLWGAYQDMRLRSAAQDWSSELRDLGRRHRGDTPAPRRARRGFFRPCPLATGS